MIFKLLIVDDEATMRRGIANYMNWASIDCEVAGTASDGAEAIDFLSRTSVDVVITDIKMPEADGLDVARYVYENHPDTKVILLTGYADFSYAQTAIRYNVSAFILKPTNKKALFEAVQDAQKELLTSRRHSSRLKEEMAFLKDQTLQELTDQPLTPELIARLKKYEIELNFYYVAAFQVIPISDDVAFLKNIIITEKQNAYCYRYNTLIVCIYFVEETQAQLPDSVFENITDITDIARNLHSLQTAAGISSLHEGVSQFGSAVSEAICALTANFYSENNIALFSPTLNNGNSDLTAEDSMYLFQFENSLNNRNFREAQSILSSMFMKFKSNFVHSREVKNICAQIYYICCRVLIKRESESINSDFLTKIQQASDIFALENQTEKLLCSTQEHLLGTFSGQNRLVDSAIAYIHAHLRDNLSLETLAEQLHISPSHLSRTFKKTQQQSLTEYINKARIEKAQEYLSDPETLTYEAAQLVGYNDATYFSSIFKKYTGVSPTDYRQNLKTPSKD